jgi:hypothetical protein
MQVKFTLTETDITKLCAQACSEVINESGKFDAAFEHGAYSRSVVVTFTPQSQIPVDEAPKPLYAPEAPVLVSEI